LDLTLPPVFNAVRLREVGDAFAHAQTIAGKSGAGTLVHVGRFDLVEFALVLEPEEPLRGARRVFYAGMVALTDALAAHAAPETAIGIEWPDALYVNYGLVGGARLAWPKRAGEEEIPPWLVFGAMIRMVSMTGVEAGVNPSSTALEEEGFGEVSADRLIESFSRHFMVAVDAWQESGFAVVMRDYVQRMPREKRLRGDIDENGDFVLHGGGVGGERKSLVHALAYPSWVDQKTKLPYA
jgi:biotin-(acetyl-CoA carboxylase) ligase